MKQYLKLQSSMQTGLETANELGTSLKGQLQEAERDCTALQAALREEEVETDTLRGSLAEQQAQAASLEEHLNSTEVRHSLLCTASRVVQHARGPGIFFMAWVHIG